MKKKDEIGTPFDDGVWRGVKVKYADKARAEIEHYEKHGYPTGTETGPDPLDTAMQEAERFLAHVKAADPDTLGEGDARHAQRFRAIRRNLREALEGGDVRHAARAGVAFGKALEQMRVRLEASAVKRGRKVRKGAQDGQAATYGTEHEKQERWARYLATCNAIWARNPHMYYSDIVRLAAKEHNVSEVTIKRHCPRKKLDHCPPKI